MNTTQFRGLFPSIITNSILKDSYLDRVIENLNYTVSPNDKYRISEEDNQWSIDIPLPGASKQDVQISLKSTDRLIVEVVAENIWSTGEKREFKLPTSAEVDAISAEMNNGILNISIPKKKAFQDKLVKVK